MKKEQILHTVIRINLNREMVGDKCDSAFAAVHQCISTAGLEPSERAKKEKLIRILQSFWRGTNSRIDGCKREQIQKIAAVAFGIDSAQASSLRKEIRQYTFQELYQYYCYAERIAKADTSFIQYLQKRQQEKQSFLAAQKEKREQEKQKVLEEKQRQMDKLCGIDRWKYDIFEKKQDMGYFQELDNKEKFSADDRTEVARLLMEYWKMIKKWEGDQVSKKQINKIAKIQSILGTEQQ